MSQLSNKQDFIFLWTTFDASEGQEMVQNQDAKPLISIAPEGLRYQDTSPEKPGMEKEGSPKLCDCMLKLEYRELSFSTRWMTTKTASRTKVSPHCHTGSNLFRERKQGTFHTGPATTISCTSFPGQSNSVWYEKLLSNTSKNDWSRYLCCFFWLSPPFETTAASIKRERLGKKQELDLDD